jgi:hypothetical protein
VDARARVCVRMPIDLTPTNQPQAGQRDRHT